MSKPLRPGFLIFVSGVLLTILTALYVVLAELWLGFTAPNTPNIRTGQIFPWHIDGRHGFDGITHYITKLNYIVFHVCVVGVGIGIILLLISVMMLPKNGNRPSTKPFWLGVPLAIIFLAYGASGLLLVNHFSRLSPVSAATMPASAPQPVTPNLVCGSGQPSALPAFAGPPVAAEVIAFIASQQAQELIKQTETSTRLIINPIYIHNQRVVVQLAAGLRVIVLVPEGMTVSIGQSISFFYAHTDPNDPCQYTPNIIAKS